MNMDWKIDDIPEDMRVNHIIECLNEYVNEVEEEVSDSTYFQNHNKEIVDTANFYRSIIRYLEMKDPIVKCKDCQHKEYRGHNLWCKIFNCIMNETNFCCFYDKE